jgi:hypothetical protein
MEALLRVPTYKMFITDLTTKVERKTAKLIKSINTTEEVTVSMVLHTLPKIHKQDVYMMPGELPTYQSTKHYKE